MSIDAANIAQRDQLSAAELQQLVETEQNSLKVQQLRLQVSEARRAAHWSEMQREFEIANRAIESIYDGFTPDIVDPLERWNETRDFHGVGIAGGWPSQIEDTKDGHYRPFWQTLTEYRDLMGLLRDIAKGHELGETIAQKVVDYVVHTGFTHSIEAKNPKDLSDATEAAAAAAQQILDEFHQRTKWRCHREANFVAETIQFGEQLVWIRHAGDGKAELIDVPLEQIAEPQPKYHATLEEVYGLPPCSWSYGVATPEGDTSKVLGFFWDRDHTGVNYDFIPIAEAMWIKVNTPDQVKRGMSDFYPLLPLMKISKPLLRNVGVQAAIQASIAYIRAQDKNTGGTGGVTAYGPSGGALVRGRTRDNMQAEIHRPGAIHDTNGVDYHASPMGNSQAGEYINVHDAILRIMGQRWEMPEYLISGVADTANKSTTEDSSEPWYRRVERTQVFFASYFTEADRRVLAIAISRGRLASVGILSMEEFDALLQVTVKGAPTKRSRPEDEIDGDLGLVRDKIMSRQTHREKLNLNHDVEERRIAEETAQDLDREQERLKMQAASAPEPNGPPSGMWESVTEHLGPGDHPSGTPQSSHGRGGKRRRKPTADATSRQAAQNMADAIRKAGGFTLQPVSGAQPVKGYAVSPFPEAEMAVNLNDLTVDRVYNWVREHAAAFKDDRVHAGGWHDTETGVVYLDLSIVVDDRTEAEQIARQYNQEGIYDLQAGETIIVKAEQDRRRSAGGDRTTEGRDRRRVADDERKHRQGAQAGNERQRLIEAAALIWADYPGGAPDV